MMFEDVLPAGLVRATLTNRVKLSVDRVRNNTYRVFRDELDCGWVSYIKNPGHWFWSSHDPKGSYVGQYTSSFRTAVLRAGREHAGLVGKKSMTSGVQMLPVLMYHTGAESHVAIKFPAGVMVLPTNHIYTELDIAKLCSRVYFKAKREFSKCVE